MQYDHFGAQVSARFQFYLAGILGAYSARVAAGDGKTNVSDFRNACYALLIGLENDVRKLARDYLATLPNGGHEAGLRAFEAYMDAVAQQPIVTLANRLQHGVQSVGNVLTRAAGSLGALIQQRLAAPIKLTARDSAGRAWQIEKLVPVMARDFAYQAYISDHLERVRLAGADKVDIVYADSTRNLTVTLREAFERRAALFHVNATAMIGSTHVPG